MIVTLVYHGNFLVSRISEKSPKDISNDILIILQIADPGVPWLTLNCPTRFPIQS